MYAAVKGAWHKHACLGKHARYQFLSLSSRDYTELVNKKQKQLRTFFFQPGNNPGLLHQNPSIP